MQKINIAVVGVTGVVGQTFLKVLEEQALPIDNFYAFASKKSAGKTISFNGRDYIVEELTESSFDRKIHIALFSAGGEISKKFAPIAAKSGCITIDNSSFWRMDPNVPLVVPEVNPKDAFKHKGIIANPNCSTIQAVVALKPLHDAFKIKRIVYSTYQAVSGAGIKGITDLQEGLKGNPNKSFLHPIVNNCLPQIDVFEDNGYTKEEIKMINETRKILNDNSIKITATAVRVPVLNSHSEAINVEFYNQFDLNQAIYILSNFNGVKVINDWKNNQYPLATTSNDTDLVYVGRIRRDESVENGLNLWVVADNIRKGAATNAVQIAQLIIKNFNNI